MNSIPNTIKRVLITGASGFIGQALCNELSLRGWQVIAALRKQSALVTAHEQVIIPSIDGDTDWTAALQDVDVVIHLAARVHVMHEIYDDPQEKFKTINFHATTNLARQASQGGVKRLVYISTIKVNGQTTEKTPFSATDEVNPQDPYAVSKWMAEQALHNLSRQTGLEVVVVRPPLVYGPGVKGNFFRLLQFVDHGLPMPFGATRNLRSMLYLGNLVDALVLCAIHPAAAGKTYLLSDGEDISTPILLRHMSESMGRKLRIFSAPSWLLQGGATILEQRPALDRVTESLRLDSAPIRNELGWVPKYSVMQGLKATTEWYLQKSQTITPALPKSSLLRSERFLVSVVIVNYNAGDILVDCIRHALQQANQVIVVDNASKDTSLARARAAFPMIDIIPNERNLGFAKACNQGALLAKGEHIFFLNPDCLLGENAIATLVQAAASDAKIAMVGGLLINPDGTEQVGGRRGVPTPWRSFVKAFGFTVLESRYPKLFADFALHKQPLPDGPIEVEAISGACMLAKREALEQVGLLDEGYFMHCEDLDWCMRFRCQGWKLLFVPAARMTHHKGHCSQSRPFFVEWNKHKGMLRFYNKFFRHQYPGVLMWLVTAGVLVRFSAIVGYHLLNTPVRWTRPANE